MLVRVKQRTFALTPKEPPTQYRYILDDNARSILRCTSGVPLGPLPAHLALSSAGVNSSQERTMTRAGSDHGGGTRARGRGKGRGKAASTLVVLVEREAACRSARGNSCYVG